MWRMDLSVAFFKSRSLPQESYTYKDPITEFVECLYVNFDFDSAQKKLRECESVRKSSKGFIYKYTSSAVCQLMFCMVVIAYIPNVPPPPFL